MVVGFIVVGLIVFGFIVVGSGGVVVGGLVKAWKKKKSEIVLRLYDQTNKNVFDQSLKIIIIIIQKVYASITLNSLNLIKDFIKLTKKLHR